VGIDPGLSRCGYGVVDAAGPTSTAVAYGVIRTPTDTPVAERLSTLHRELGALFDEMQPQVVGVERVLFQTNARTAMAVGQASGIALLAAADRGIPVTEFSPNEVKLAVTGYGAADKAQVQAMVARVRALGEIPSPPDAADALALALCAAQSGSHAEIHAGAGTEASGRDPSGGSAYDRAVAAALAKESQ
jgi:crossover junction endodeoxyribonuclease RuvC